MSHWARKYIGKGYASDGIGPDEFNCWTLVVDVQARIYGRSMPFCSDAVGIGWAEAAQKIRNVDKNKYGWELTRSGLDGDVILMGHGRYATHAGVWVENGILHCLEDCGVIFSRLTPVVKVEWPTFEIYRYIWDK